MKRFVAVGLFLSLLLLFAAPRLTALARTPDSGEFIDDHTLTLYGDIWHCAPTVADLDRDGTLEIIACTDGGGSVYVWHADGELADGWPQQAGRVCCAPAVGDLDGDGKIEIVVNGTHAWRYDGTPLPGWPQPGETGSCFSPPALADVNGNGRLEIINGSAPKGAVYVRDRHGSILNGWPQSTGGEVRAAPAIGDIDGDGKPEIVVGSWDFKVYAWHADGAPVSGWAIRLGQRIEEQAVLYDLNRDGVLDVLVGADRLYAFDGKGRSLPGWEGGKPWNGRAPCVADINGDGQPEILANGPYWYRLDGTELPRPAHMLYGDYTDSAVAGDVDNDGRVEMLWTMRSDNVPAYRVDGTQPPGWPLHYFSRDGDSSCTLADLDGDGDTDVLIACANYRIYVFDTPGKFGPKSCPWPMIGGNNRRNGIATDIELAAPKNPLAYRATPVRRALARGDFGAALRYYEPIARTDTNWGRRARARLSMARIYFPRTNQPRGAMRAYAQLLAAAAPAPIMIDAGVEVSDLARARLDDDPALLGAFRAATWAYARWLGRHPNLPPRQAAKATYVLALLYRWNDDPRALAVAGSIAAEGPDGMTGPARGKSAQAPEESAARKSDGCFSRLAAEIVQFGDAQHLLSLELRKSVETTIQAVDLKPGDRITTVTSWNLVTNAHSPVADLFPGVVTVETNQPVNPQWGPQPDAVEREGGVTRLTWKQPLRTSYLGWFRIDGHAFGLEPAEVVNRDITVTRRLEPLGDDRYRATVTAVASAGAHVRASIFRSGYSIESETVGPGLRATTSDIVDSTEEERSQSVAGAPAASRTYTFVMRAPAGAEPLLPDVYVSTGGRRQLNLEKIAPMRTYHGQTADYRFTITSPRTFNINQIEEMPSVVYHLPAMAAPKGG